MSNSADSPGTHPAPPRACRLRTVALRVLTCAVFALAGLIFFTSFDTAKGTNIRTDDSAAEALRPHPGAQPRRTASWTQSNGVRATTSSRLARQRRRPAARPSDARLGALEKAAGTSGSPGPALTVTLNDAPPNATAKLPGYPEPQPNDLVIHQQDLQAVVNALWQGGAEGIKVDGPAADLHQRGALRRQHPDPPGPRLLAAVQDHRRRRPGEAAEGARRLPRDPELHGVREGLRARLEGRGRRALAPQAARLPWATPGPGDPRATAQALPRPPWAHETAAGRRPRTRR